VAVKSSGDFSAEAARVQKIEEQVVADLDQRSDENTPSLTRGAVAEERQIVSSKYTIDEMADAMEATMSVSGHPIYRKKCGNIG